MRKATQAESLGHQRQVLQYLALLYCGELVEPSLDKGHGGEATLFGIVVQVPTLRSRESRDASGLEAVALVHQEVAEVLAERGEQNVDIESGELVDRQEV